MGAWQKGVTPEGSSHSVEQKRWSAEAQPEAQKSVAKSQ